MACALTFNKDGNCFYESTDMTITQNLIVRKNF